MNVINTRLRQRRYGNADDGHQLSGRRENETTHRRQPDQPDQLYFGSPAVRKGRCSTPMLETRPLRSPRRKLARSEAH